MPTTTKSMERTKKVALNAFIAALYVVLCFIGPASGAIQFRVSEALNHVVVFNRKLLWGVLLGVVIFNQFFGYGLTDTLFGGGQTLLALLLSASLQNLIKNEKIRLGLNVVFFTVSMFMIAIMLHYTAGAPFWPTYGTLALSEGIIMSISAPVMYLINQKVHFEKQI